MMALVENGGFRSLKMLKMQNKQNLRFVIISKLLVFRAEMEVPRTSHALFWI